MGAYQVVTHQQKEIVIVDISNASAEEIINRLQIAQNEIEKLSPKSALVLTNAENAIYNTQTSRAIKEFTAHNTPYVKASAVIGADGLRAVLVKTVGILTNREIKAFDDKTEAMNWLAAH